MTRGLILIAGLFTAGCSGDPPPIREAAPVAGEKVVVAAFAPPAKPDKSDPAADKLLAAAVAAHTGNDRAKLAKLTAVSLRREGLTTTAVGTRAPLDWRADLLAPGRYRAEAVLKHPNAVESFTVVIVPDAGSLVVADQPKAKIEGVKLRDCHVQRMEDEFMLVHPLADPTTVAVPAPDETVNGAAAAGAYVWSPALAPALVHFDKATGRVVRVVYRGRENDSEVLKEITVREHREFGGVWLPSKFELRVNGRVFIDVEKQTFEIGKTFDAARFVP